ncbi:MAG: thiamine pyrophosphate-binding protein [Oscillospiraceae bacterium]|nr:thiamine pyrophosphate-binding protein [Oscillospiraceae bacterium]
MYTGGQVVMEFLKREGVPYVIGIPGHGVLSLFDALRRAEAEGAIKYIQVKHEQSAVHMADGYFRVSGKPLATLSSIGPGSLNTGIGLATAYVDSSAVLALCGDTHTNMMGVGVLQEIERTHDSNFLRSIEPLVKRCWRVENADTLARIMNRAFTQMLTGRKGPVALALPMDVMAQDTEIKENMEVAPIRAENRVKVDSESIAKAVEMLRAAKRPVILAGGAALRERAAEEIKAVAELANAAVVTTLAGKSAFPENHPLYCFHTGSKGTKIGLEITRDADLVLAVGARFADETTCSYREGAAFSFPKTKLIHVDICPEEIGKNYRADLGIIGDLKTVLADIAANYGEATEHPEYVAEIAQKRADWAELLKNRRAASTEGLTISQLLGEMEAVLPENTIISTSSGNTQAQLFQEYCFKTPYTNLTTGGFSTMGWALPAAMGAKLASPESPVVALMGDGDFMMTMQELSTMAQYDIPMTVVLADNCGWHAIKDLQIDAYGKDYAFGNDWKRNGETYGADFCAIAKAFGLEVWHATTPEEANKAIGEGVACNKPAMVVCDVRRDHPFTGGEAFGWWDVPVPGYIEDRKEGFEIGRSEERFTY